MNCPKCGGKTNTSEVFKDANGTYRMRKCIVCGNRFPTTECASDGKMFNKLKYQYYKER